jgi:hypothetical protein
VPDWIATAVAEKQTSDAAKVAALSGKLERDASQLAAQEQKVADQVAAEQAAATEDASRKPLLGRVFGGKKGDPEPEPVTTTATVTTEAEPAATAAVEPAPAAKPKAAAAVPAPEPVPTVVDQTTTATTAAPEPARKLSSDFDWPEDEVAAGGTKFLPSGLDVAPPTAN